MKIGYASQGAIDPDHRSHSVHPGCYHYLVEMASIMVTDLHISHRVVHRLETLRPMRRLGENMRHRSV